MILWNCARVIALTSLALSTTACAGAAPPPTTSAAPPSAVAKAEALPSPAPTPEPTQGGVQADPAFTQRIDEIVQIMNGEGDIAQTFSPGFLAQVPATRLARMARNMRNAYGAVEAVSRIELETPFRGKVFVDLERSQLELEVGVDPKAPHHVRGLLISTPGR